MTWISRFGFVGKCQHSQVQSSQCPPSFHLHKENVSLATHREKEEWLGFLKPSKGFQHLKKQVATLLPCLLDSITVVPVMGPLAEDELAVLPTAAAFVGWE